MVLQQAPYQANVWGYTADCGDKVTVNFNQNDYPATMIMGKIYAYAYHMHRTVHGASIVDILKLAIPEDVPISEVASF